MQNLRQLCHVNTYNEGYLPSRFTYRLTEMQEMFSPYKGVTVVPVLSKPLSKRKTPYTTRIVVY